MTLIESYYFLCVWKTIEHIYRNMYLLICKLIVIAFVSVQNIQVKHFTLAGVDIPCEENVKLLGVELDFVLNFDKQIKNMCMKAVRQLNVLQRLSKFLSVETRLLIFKSFIQSNFNLLYGISVARQILRN